jgi:hypothetical protein
MREKKTDVDRMIDFSLLTKGQGKAQARLI